MKVIDIIVAGALILFVVSALLSLPVMLLWDWLMPTIFGLKKITWFQAWGLMFLCGLLFKSHTTVNKN
jgi:hypothetical protein